MIPFGTEAHSQVLYAGASLGSDPPENDDHRRFHSPLCCPYLCIILLIVAENNGAIMGV